MDHVEQLGERAIVSRMKRLAERMHQDNAQIFKEYDIPFEPRWFLLLSLLDRQSPLSIMEISRELALKHPTVNQLAKEIIRQGFIEEITDKADKRKRLLGLTPQGHKLLASVRPLWEDMTAAAHEVIQACGYDVIAVLSSIEDVLSNQSYYERMRRHIRQREWARTEVIPFEAKHQSFFCQINTAWLDTWQASDPQTEKQLASPQKEIIGKHGAIFVACIEGQPVGTCALLKREPASSFEVTYLAVAPEHQGKQIGAKLVKTALDYASTTNTSVIRAYVDYKMIQAINLFRKRGFLIVPAQERQGKPNTVLLQLTLKQTPSGE